MEHLTAENDRLRAEKERTALLIAKKRTEKQLKSQRARLAILEKEIEELRGRIRI